MLPVDHEQLLELLLEFLCDLGGGAQGAEVFGDLELETDVALALGDVAPSHVQLALFEVHAYLTHIKPRMSPRLRPEWFNRLAFCRPGGVDSTMSDRWNGRRGVRRPKKIRRVRSLESHSLIQVMAWLRCQAHIAA